MRLLILLSSFLVLKELSPTVCSDPVSPSDDGSSTPTELASQSPATPAAAPSQPSDSESVGSGGKVKNTVGDPTTLNLDWTGVHPTVKKHWEKEWSKKVKTEHEEKEAMEKALKAAFK